ncbi:hypothetical protein M405DRAFT_125612 [Rhizopogon salebrosus TDB-379]|nr:hypothetical protein M405DRAFT_125612 [Rhizopogon salebrosus TDB-379]
MREVVYYLMLRDLSTSSQDEPFKSLTCDSVGVEKLFPKHSMLNGVNCEEPTRGQVFLSAMRQRRSIVTEFTTKAFLKPPLQLFNDIL